MPSTLDFSAQFGGRNAAAAVLPHFKLLKEVAKNCLLPEFPFETLAFILRVDGDVNAYGLSGPGNLDFEKTEYVSVDIGIAVEDYQDGQERLLTSVAEAIRASVSFMRSSGDERLQNVNFEQLDESIDRLSHDYEDAFRQQAANN